MIVIEIGNSNIKIAHFEDDKIIDYCRISDFEAILPIEWKKKLIENNLNIIVAGSGNIREWIAQQLRPLFISPKIISFEDIPLQSNYLPPSSMGIDRCLGAYYSYQICQKACVYIDCGTCLTTTVVDKDGVIVGGSISPGLKMRLQSMHKYTYSLPLIEKLDKEVPIIGKNTIESMQSGTKYGFIAEIEWRLAQIKSIYGDIEIFNTGGDAEIVMNQIKFPIFADFYLIPKAIYHLSKNL